MLASSQASALWLSRDAFRQACTGELISELGGNSSTSRIKIGIKQKVEITVNYRTVAESGDLVVVMCGFALRVGREIVCCCT